MIYHKFVLIFEFKYILSTMQPRLKLKSRDSSPLLNTILKGLAVVILIGLAFYLLDKVDFPSPKNELKENVTNQIIKLK